MHYNLNVYIKSVLGTGIIELNSLNFSIIVLITEDVIPSLNMMWVAMAECNPHPYMCSLTPWTEKEAEVR